MTFPGYILHYKVPILYVERFSYLEWDLGVEPSVHLVLTLLLYFSLCRPREMPRKCIPK